MEQKYGVPTKEVINHIENLKKVQRLAMRVCLGQWDLKQEELTVSIWPCNSRVKKINCKNVSLVRNVTT